jgi:predicted Rdx family selenoprotein
VTLIKERLNIETVLTPGTIGQFEVIADGKRIAERGGNWFTRSFGAGYPDLEGVVEQLKKHRGSDAAR